MAGTGFFLILIAAYIMWRALNVNPGHLFQITESNPVWQALKVNPEHLFQISVGNWDNMVAGTLLLLIGVFICGVPLAEGVDHPLPMVEIKTRPDDQTSTETNKAEVQKGTNAQEGTVSIEGLLVAHTESYWHLFVSEPNRWESRLESIPDDRVKDARIHEREQ
jgi:hypothetical protein